MFVSAETPKFNNLEHFLLDSLHQSLNRQLLVWSEFVIDMLGFLPQWKNDGPEMPTVLWVKSFVDFQIQFVSKPADLVFSIKASQMTIFDLVKCILPCFAKSFYAKAFKNFPRYQFVFDCLARFKPFFFRKLRSSFKRSFDSKISSLLSLLEFW